MHDEAPGAPFGAQLSAVIVAFHSAEVLPDCLRALRAAAPQAEVRVVDNSVQPTQAAAVAAVTAREWPGAHYEALAGNPGYAAAINVGIAGRRHHGPVLILNPDARVTPGAVRALADGLRPGIGITVPRMLDEHGGVSASLRRRPTVLRTLGQSLLGRRADRFAALSETIAPGAVYARAHDVDWATGAALLISPDCLAAVGAWDESFWLYSEETDFCLRAADAGFAVRYLPQAVVSHDGGESGTSPVLYTALTLNRVELIRRRGGRARGLAARAAAIPGEAVRSATGRRTSRAALGALLDPRKAPPSVRAARGGAAGPGAVPAGVLCFSAQDFWYHNRAHSDVQLMRRLARDRKVLLVNSIGLRMPLPGRSTHPLRRVGRKLASTGRLLRRPEADYPGLHVYSPLILPLYGSARARALNARLVAAQVRGVLRLMGVRRPTCVVTIPTAVDVLPQLDLGGVILNRSDRHSEFGESDQDSIRAMEERLLRDSDAVLYVSQSLLEDDADLVGDRAVFLDHGVDLARFGSGPYPRPSDVPAGPVIGFFGALDDYTVDLALLARLAREIPEAALVLVGQATCDLPELEALANVHLLGRRPYEQIPAYGAAFDVAIMPWLTNEWIRLSNPIKMKEYLALGRPVVSTDFPAVHRYAEVIRVAADAAHFVALVRQSLADAGPADPAARRAAVQESSWDAVGAHLARVCDQVRQQDSRGR